MTKLLQKALEVVRRLSPDSQDEIERVTLSLTGDQEECTARGADGIPAALRIARS